MGELSKYMPDGYAAPLWLITAALAMRMFGFDKILFSFWQTIALPWLKGKVDRADVRERSQIAGYLGDDAVNEIVYGRYISVGRHLIGVAWSVLSDYREGNVTEEKLVDRLRVGSRDFLQAAKHTLSRYIAYSSRCALSAHLEGMNEKSILEFYAPIVAAIVELKSLGHRLGYEELRLAVLMETDNMIAQAVDEILTEKNKNDGTSRSNDKRK